MGARGHRASRERVRRRGGLGIIAGRRSTALAALLAAGALAGCAGSSTNPGSAYQAAQPVAIRASWAQPKPATSPLAGLPASGVLAMALSTMKAAVSVHADVREVRQSRVAVYSDDAARGAGRQEITISGGEHAMVLVVGKVTYIKGNEAALTGYFGFPSAAAGRLVNRWISFRPGNTGYQELTSGVILAGLAGQLELPGPLTIKAPGMVAGRPAVGVHGTVPASVGAPAGSKATLYVAASGRALPVGYRLDRTGSLQFAATFSRWGERLHLTAPSQAIPVTSISL
jgi:hypothetical protein